MAVAGQWVSLTLRATQRFWRDLARFVHLCAAVISVMCVRGVSGSLSGAWSLHLCQVCAGLEQNFSISHDPQILFTDMLCKIYRWYTSLGDVDGT